MTFIKCICGAIIGTTAGITIWTAITFFTGYELGLVAWLMGVMVGIGVASFVGPSRGILTALFAACFSIMAVIGGKAGTAYVISQQTFDEYGAMGGPVTEELLVSYVADEIVLEYQHDGRDLDYPSGADLDMPTTAADYPAEVWADAQARWVAMPIEDREHYRSMAEFEIQAQPYIAFFAQFFSSFALFDLLWLGLAVTSAFKIVHQPKPKPESTHNVDPVESEDPGPGFLPMVPASPPVEPAPVKKAG